MQVSQSNREATVSALQRQDPTSSQAVILELATEQFDAHWKELLRKQ